MYTDPEPTDPGVLFDWFVQFVLWEHNIIFNVTEKFIL